MAYLHQFVNYVEKASVVPGICLNLLLIYLVNKYSQSDIGTFRYLLVIFASYDIILIVLHFIFDPVIIFLTFETEAHFQKYVVLPGIFSGVLDFPYGSPITMNTEISRNRTFESLAVFHSECFMISYAILITHLLYRYWVVHKPHKIALFSSPIFLLKLCAPVVGVSALIIGVCSSILSPEDSVGTMMIREEFIRTYGRDIESGWMVAEYWKPNGQYNFAAIAAAATVDAAGVVIVVAVVTLSSLTYHHISVAFGLSSRAKAAQMRLLKTVCVQTFVPMVCVAIPYFCNTTLPIFGVTLPLVAETCGLSMSLFPSFDPLAVIILMKPYREGLRTLITRSIRKVEPAVPISTTGL